MTAILKVQEILYLDPGSNPTRQLMLRGAPGTKMKVMTKPTRPVMALTINLF